MRVTGKLAASAAAVCIVSGWCSTMADASSLSDKQHEMAQLQQRASQTERQLEEQRKQVGKLQGQVAQTRQQISQLSQEIAQNQTDIQGLEHRIAALNERIVRQQRQLDRDKHNVESMLKATYEYGNVPLLQVLFQASGWADLLSRVQTLSAVTEREHRLMQEVEQLEHDLRADKREQENNLQSLIAKGRNLVALKRSRLALERQQQSSLELANRGISSLMQQRQELTSRIQLTRQQIAELKRQAAQQERIIATPSGDVTVPILRWHDLSVDKLYAYVQQQGSTFSRADIETICAAARRYDVNPALLVAITGQEQAFVPPGPDADLIRNNPFNVFYSWQVYNTTLADAANIAADTIRHKLSTPPPKGEDAILWLNDPHNPWGIYATDPNWAYGVRRYFNSILSFVG
ncbi:murein hydrolase activator EnvC family protein [Alicyclobacillus kakegawensis]|uniref:murein hydrolase activator EnvC family protein n=1 Tax=Alicyclobacillus kakegawensis TaxID=392012 RepID=UPI000AE4C3B6|nr:hypothetical protein [Alicyclobacillus kakegawensis]